MRSSHLISLLDYCGCNLSRFDISKLKRKKISMGHLFYVYSFIFLYLYYDENGVVYNLYKTM